MFCKRICQSKMNVKQFMFKLIHLLEKSEGPLSGLHNNAKFENNLQLRCRAKDVLRSKKKVILAPCTQLFEGDLQGVE